jgi:hypothetical protein
MNNTKLMAGLTIVNLGILVVLLVTRSGVAEAAVPSVLRARTLEIVDDQGRVRASIKVQPAEVFGPSGKAYPETVVLRLIDGKGRPEVKIAASEAGGGISLIGKSDDTQALLRADGHDSSLKLANSSGRQQLLKP